MLLKIRVRTEAFLYCCCRRYAVMVTSIPLLWQTTERLKPKSHIQTPWTFGKVQILIPTWMETLQQAPFWRQSDNSQRIKLSMCMNLHRSWALGQWQSHCYVCTAPTLWGPIPEWDVSVFWQYKQMIMEGLHQYPRFTSSPNLYLDPDLKSALKLVAQACL